MKMVRVDYLIAGAGLVGSVTGSLLKKACADVLALELLDAKTKEKLCDGIMNKGKGRLCILRRYLAKAARMHCGLCKSQSSGTGMPGVKYS